MPYGPGREVGWSRMPLFRCCVFKSARLLAASFCTMTNFRALGSRERRTTRTGCRAAGSASRDCKRGATRGRAVTDSRTPRRSARGCAGSASAGPGRSSRSRTRRRRRGRRSRASRPRRSGRRRRGFGPSGRSGCVSWKPRPKRDGRSRTRSSPFDCSRVAARERARLEHGHAVDGAAGGERGVARARRRARCVAVGRRHLAPRATPRCSPSRRTREAWRVQVGVPAHERVTVAAPAALGGRGPSAATGTRRRARARARGRPMCTSAPSGPATSSRSSVPSVTPVARRTSLADQEAEGVDVVAVRRARRPPRRLPPRARSIIRAQSSIAPSGSGSRARRAGRRGARARDAA